MIIIDQTIPPELQAEYDKLITKKPTASGLEFVARTKPSATKPASTKKTSVLKRDYEEAVDFLIAYITESTGEAPPPDFRLTQINNLLDGYFDPSYWQTCTELSSDTLENAPATGAFVGVRNYAYPDPANQPSTPTYGAGVSATGDPAYTGWTTGGIFADTGLRWIRKVFTLKNKFTRGTPEPLFLKLSGTITATASTRPSRAMISAVIKRWLVTDTSARLTTTEAPITEVISALWRYKTPHGIAPYFALTKPLQLMYFMRSDKYEETPGDLTRAVVLIAPMPMMGKRFNNNTSVTSTIAATIELWQILKPGPMATLLTANIQGATSYNRQGGIVKTIYPDSKIYRGFADLSTGPEIILPWTAGDLLKKIVALGDDWCFIYSVAPTFLQWKMIKLFAGDTFSAVMDFTIQDYIIASRFGELNALLQGTGNDFYWLNIDGSIHYLDVHSTIINSYRQTVNGIAFHFVNDIPSMNYLLPWGLHIPPGFFDIAPYEISALPESDPQPQDIFLIEQAPPPD